jgi:hypothetical protein
MREHNVAALTAAELDAARRELAVCTVIQDEDVGGVRGEDVRA